MGLHILACIKRTPASTSVAVDPKTGAIQSEGLSYAMNPLDEYAVEEALRLKERVPDSKVTVLTLGQQQADEVLRSALALGADSGVLLCDPSFDASDTYATSYLLSCAVRKLSETQGPVNLVLCGKQTNEGESGHVGPQLAAWLDWPSCVSVKKIPEISGTAVVVERLMEDGTDTLKLALPAVLSTTKEINEPRLPSLKGKMAAKKAAIMTWGAAELKAEVSWIGRNSPTLVTKTSPTPARPSGLVIAGDTPEEKAANLVQKLKEAKLL